MARFPSPANPLLGRDTELTAITTTLERSPIVTLTGPPGVGKTRLAVEVAMRLDGRYTDGVALVALGQVTSRELARSELARAVQGSADSGAGICDVATYIGRRSMLLVLDDLDHVVDLGVELAQLVADCPRLRLLATSREPLHVSVEREFPVPPLAMPSEEDGRRVDRLLAVPSVQLLVARARAVAPDLDITAANAADVARLCAGLDGLPLAYELMAPNLKVFTPGELADRLGDRLALAAAAPRDVAERHRTLRTAIRWSHDLLPPPLSALFRRSAVFAASWTVSDAAAVCAIAPAEAGGTSPT